MNAIYRGRPLAGTVLTSLLLAASVGYVALTPSAKARMQESSIQRYADHALTLVFEGDRLVGFQIDRLPENAYESHQRESSGSGQSQVMPGIGALGVGLGETREAVMRRLGSPSESYGFGNTVRGSGVDVYRRPRGYITVTVDENGVSQVSGYGMPFESPTGFRRGMSSARVEASIGAPDERRSRAFYRVSGPSLLTIVALTVLAATAGALVLVLAVQGLGQKRTIAVMEGAIGIWALVYWLRPIPLLAEGMYPMRIGPACGATSWALTWAGAALMAAGFGSYIDRHGQPRALPFLRVLMVIPSIMGAALLNLLVRLGCSLSALALSEPILHASSNAWSISLGVLMLGGLTGTLLAADRWADKRDNRRRDS